MQHIRESSQKFDSVLPREEVQVEDVQLKASLLSFLSFLDIC